MENPLFFLDEKMRLVLNPKGRKSGYRMGLWCALAVVKAVNEDPEHFPGVLIWEALWAIRKRADEGKGHQALLQGFLVGLSRAMVICSEFSPQAISYGWDELRANALAAKRISI